VYDHAIECENCSDPQQQGIGMSIILAEAEPVGGFVGMSISEPLMQIGTLATVFAYMRRCSPGKDTSPSLTQKRFNDLRQRITPRAVFSQSG
jgi:hypothetical protein